jgi:hypothetical protein
MTITAVRPTPKMMPARRTVQVPTTAPKRPARPQQTSITRQETKPVQPSAASTEETQQRPGESATRQFTPRRTKASRPVPVDSPRQKQLEERFEKGGTLTAKELTFLLRVRPDLESKIQPKLVKAKSEEAKKKAANKAKRADANRATGKAHMNGGKKK